MTFVFHFVIYSKCRKADNIFYMCCCITACDVIEISLILYNEIELVDLQYIQEETTVDNGQHN